MSIEITTFDDDLLGLAEFADRLEKFIEIEQHFVEGSLVIGLDSKFGFGKTTFLKMWKNKLENTNPDIGIPLVISLNAWESDYYGNPLFAILSNLIEAIEQKEKKPPVALIEAAKNTGWFATAIGGQIAKKATGIDTVAAGKLAEEKESKRNNNEVLNLDAFSNYNDHKKAMESLKLRLKQYVNNSEPNVIFFVDELDRCRPDYAITYLETIKHIFDLQGAVFILAADRHHLENSAKKAFGTNLNFDEYYRKFVQREIKLPSIAESGYSNIATSYVSYYLERENIRHCILDLNSARIDNIVKLVGGLKMTPRQIQEMFRLLGHILHTDAVKMGQLPWGIGVGSIAMAAFKVSDKENFRLIGNRQLNPDELISYLVKLFGDAPIDWWFALFISGDAINNPAKFSLIEILTRCGFSQSQEMTKSQQWKEAWSSPTMKSSIPQIYEKIEQLSQWD